jgi:DNA polymerase elongation subunit (family B)
MTAKILLLDLETFPNLGYTWGKYEQNVIEIVRPTFLLSFSYKWLGSDHAVVKRLIDYDGYQNDPENDKSLVIDLWKVLDEADIIVAHNGDSFDIKRANARFITHGLAPPSPAKTVDTLKIARKHFKFESNKLSDLGQALGLGAKLSHTGWALWKRCRDGDVDAWDLMGRYNLQDVLLLEAVYLKLLPWSATHPNVNEPGTEACPKCASTKVQRRGVATAKTRTYRRMHCSGCGTWYQGTILKKGEQ